MGTEDGWVNFIGKKSNLQIEFIYFLKIIIKAKFKLIHKFVQSRCTF